MLYTVSRLKVEDYDKFRRTFFEEGGIALRQTYGSQGGRLFRSSSDPTEIILLQEWNDLENARRFIQSNELRERQQRAGVVGFEPYEEVEHF